MWLFKRGIELVQSVGGRLLAPAEAPWLLFLLPVIGGLLVGLGMHYLIGEERHHGVAGVIEAVALAGGRLRYRRIPLKALLAAISLGSGASAGPEDPSVQIGANVGSFAGAKLHLSEDRVRALVAAGAAAGIASAFNAPIAGVFFALEIILSELSTDAMGAILLASFSSAILTQAIAGPAPAFAVPPYSMQSGWELPLYLLLGLLAGPIAAVYIRLLYFMQDAFRRARLPRWSTPMVAGLGLGLIGLILPQALGVGYPAIEAVLTGAPMTLGLLLLLLSAKLVLTPWSLGSGFVGGVFAPAMYIGAMLGGAFGIAASSLLPGLQMTAAPFAMVGMAAVLSATVRAPLTGILLLFEMTNDYRIVLPLMLAVGGGTYLSERLQRDSVYLLGLARKGIRLQRGRDVEVLEGLAVREVMQPVSTTLTETQTLAEAGEVMVRTRHHGLAVLNAAGHLVGVFTLKDLDEALAGGVPPKAPLSRVLRRRLLVAYPDETVGAALQRMGHADIGRLPVVDRKDAGRLLGMLRRADMIRAYDLALARRAAQRHSLQQERLGAFSDVAVSEVVVQAGSACDGKCIAEVSWPRGAMIVSLQRGAKLIVPHGGTRLEAGDVLAIVAQGEQAERARTLCDRIE